MIEQTGKTVVKNSSKSINFGEYDLKTRYLTDGGRLFQDHIYKTKIYCDEKKKILTLVVVENESQFDLYERQHPN